MKTKQQKRLEAIERLERPAESRRFLSKEKAVKRHQEAMRLRAQFGLMQEPLSRATP